MPKRRRVEDEEQEDESRSENDSEAVEEQSDNDEVDDNYGNAEEEDDDDGQDDDVEDEKSGDDDETAEADNKKDVNEFGNSGDTGVRDGEEFGQIDHDPTDNGIDDNPDVQRIRDPDVKPPRVRLARSAKNHEKRLIVVLEAANLEIVKIGKKFELLNCDEHMSSIRKYKKDPAFCRPDITHQVRFLIS